MSVKKSWLVLVPIILVFAFSFASAGISYVKYGYVNTVSSVYDYDGDGRADYSVYDPDSLLANSKWWINYSSDSPPSWFGTFNTDSGTRYYTYGSSNYNLPVPGDYDGDGKTDLAVYKSGSGGNTNSGKNGNNWTIRYSSSAQSVVFNSVDYKYGWAAAIPVPGDYDGDGKTDFAVYDPADGNWWINFSSGSVPSWISSLSANWNATVRNNYYFAGVSPGRFAFGWSSSKPAQADYDGDGKTDIAVANGINWYFIFSSGQVPSYFSNLSDLVVSNGQYGYYSISSLPVSNSVLPASADFNGDGFAEIATFNSTTFAIISPYIPSAPSVNSIAGGCNFGQSCGSVVLGNIIGSEVEVLWTYYYADGTKKNYCSSSALNRAKNCTQANLAVNSNLKTSYSGVSGNSFSIPLLIGDSSGKVVSRVGVSVAQVKNNLRSAWSSESIVSNVIYGCSHECNVSGSTKCLSSLNYEVCGNYDSDICYEWSSSKSCSSDFGNYYSCSSASDKCESSVGVNCVGINANSLNLFCYVGDNILNGTKESNYNCPTGQSCFSCAQNFTWNGTNCLRNNANCTSSGGYCSSLQVVGGVINETLSCSLGTDSCYICGEGFHGYGGSCISNNCTGIKPVLDSAHVNFGANNTNNSLVNMTWNYIRGVAGACQWNCSSDYKINVSDNLSCVYGRVNCSEIGGICSTTVLSNAKVSSDADCVSGSCYVCNNEQRYFSNGVSCVFNNTCASGSVWNGFACSQYVQCSSNCTLNGKCIVSEPNRIVRTNLNVDGKVIKAYCDPSSKVFVELLADNQACSYNAQCASNLCGADMRCLNIAKEVRDASSWLKSVYCWFSTGFRYSTDLNSDYMKCLNAED